MVTLLPISVLIAVLAPSFVEVILDPRWSNAASIIQILTLAGLVGMFGEMAVPLFKGLGKPSYVTTAELVQSVGIVSLAVWLVSLFGLNGGALAVLSALVLSQIASALLVNKIIAFPIGVLGRRATSVAFVSFTAGGVAWALDKAIGSVGGLIVATMISGTLVVILMWLLDSRFDLGLRRDLARAFPQITFFTERKV